MAVRQSIHHPATTRLDDDPDHDYHYANPLDRPASATRVRNDAAANAVATRRYSATGTVQQLAGTVCVSVPSAAASDADPSGTAYSAVEQADYGHLMKDAPKDAPANDQQLVLSTATTGVQTLQYADQGVGGQARQAAEANGQGQQFEMQVQTMITAMGFCPSQYRWYSDKDGYLCAGGNHAISHEHIDIWARDPRFTPHLYMVNTFNDPNASFDPYTGRPVCLRSAHPPNVDLWQPMHKQHRDFMEQVKRLGMGHAGSSGDDECVCMNNMRSLGPSGTAQMRNADMRAQMYGHTAGNFGYGFGYNA